MMMLPDPTEVMPTRNPATRPITAMPAKPFIVGGRFATLLFDLLLEQQQSGNDDQKHSNCSLDEVVDAVAVERADVHQQIHSGDRAGNAAHRQSDHHFAANRAFLQVHQARPEFW